MSFFNRPSHESNHLIQAEMIPFPGPPAADPPALVGIEKIMVSKTLPEHHQKQAPVSNRVPTAFDGGNQLFHFRKNEMFSLIHRFV